MSKDVLTEKVEELKILEGNLQLIVQQRQNLQMEVNEIENALQELNNYDDDAYKIVSGIMIKSKSDELTEWLKEKKEIAEKKIAAVEKQEEIIRKKSAEARRKIERSGVRNV